MLYGAMNFPVKPVFEELETISELGFDYLELTMEPPQAHHATIRQSGRRLVSRLQSLGMGLVCHLPSFLSIADLTDSIRRASIQEMVDSLDVAAQLRPMKVVVHPAYVTGIGVFVADQARQHSFDSMAVIVEKADQLGLVLCIENMFPRARSLVDPAEFEEVFEKFPSLKFTLDIGHGNIGAQGAGRNLEFIRRFPDRIAHVHASDNFGKEDNHLPLGAGIIDFRKIVKALKGIGYDDTVTFEVFSRDKDYLRISKEKFASMVEAH